jgi:hypothetical protein
MERHKGLSNCRKEGTSGCDFLTYGSEFLRDLTKLRSISENIYRRFFAESASSH